MWTIRLLTGEDVDVLSVLAHEAVEFDMEERADSPLTALDERDARAFLEHPDILFWVVEADGRVDGFLFCYVQYRWHTPAREVMLYEIGVRASARRRGIGRGLVERLDAWMLDNGITDVWVPADNPEAEAFYRACGFVRDDEQAVMMSKEVVPAGHGG